MDDDAFRRVAGALRGFHKRFAPLFGRKEARRHGEQYVRGLLVTRDERRNAENLAEAVVGTQDKAARALQQFLTDSPWQHEAVIAEVQRYLAEHLLPHVAQAPHAGVAHTGVAHTGVAHTGVAADGVFTLDSTGFAKRGTRSAGVSRQYSGTLGKVDTCQIGVFLGYATARGHALIDGHLWLPREWTDDPERCRRAGIPEAVVQAGYQSQAELGLVLLRRARATGALVGRLAQWITADEAFGQVPTFRDALDTEGWHYVLEVPCTTPVFTTPAQTRPVRLTRGTRGMRARPVEIQPAAQTAQEVAATLAAERWTTVTVAQGAQGPRTHRFAALRVRESRDGVPGRDCWLVLRRNLDGTEPKYSLSNAPPETPLDVLARVGATRWTVETEFQTTKGQVGLDEYEVRSWPGWHHHVTLCLLANAFLLSLQQEWGGKGPRGRPLRVRHTSPTPHTTHAPQPPRATRRDAGAAHTTPSGARPARAAATAALDPRRPAPLAHRNPTPQRPRHCITRQTPASHAA